jgi:ribulose 1,5-bisphosphate carboxylase large subunit-like protein
MATIPLLLSAAAPKGTVQNKTKQNKTDHIYYQQNHHQGDQWRFSSAPRNMPLSSGGIMPSSSAGIIPSSSSSPT